MDRIESLIQTLESLNIEQVYFCCGSRNFKLLKPLQDKFSVQIETNEYEASFMAVGAARRGKTQVVVTTSGSAVAQTLSACMEAYYSHLPLIIISADRPSFMHDYFSPQVVNQSHILKTHVRSFLHVKYNKKLNENKLSFPIHINFEINEERSQGKEKPVEISFEKALALFQGKRVLVINSLRDSRFELSLKEENGGYYLCEKSHRQSDRESISDEKACSLVLNNKVDMVFKFGETPVSKVWRLLEGETQVEVISIHPHEEKDISHGYYLPWSDIHIRAILKSIKNEQPILKRKINKKNFISSEQLIMTALYESLPEGSEIFLANSSVVRDFQHVRNVNFSNVWFSRGTNGIDGIVSQAIALSRQTTQIFYLVIGDLSLQYNLGALLSEIPNNLHIVLIDNNGGQIFQRINRNEVIGNIPNKSRFQRWLDALNPVKVGSMDEIDKSILHHQLIIVRPDNEQTLKLDREKKRIVQGEEYDFELC